MNFSGPSPAGLLRSYLEHKGWYSQFKKDFLKVESQIFLLMSYSFGQKHLDTDINNSFSHIFQEDITNVPLSLIERAVLMIMPEMTLGDINSIFTSYANNVNYIDF